MATFHKKQTATQRTFATYTREITALFLDKYGTSYATQENTRNTWRETCAYSAAAYDFLILQTRVFIRLLPHDKSSSTNPQFLDSLTSLMADYLSAYTMKQPNIANRKQAKEKLKDALYNEFGYIQTIIQKRQAKRAARQYAEMKHAQMAMINSENAIKK